MEHIIQFAIGIDDEAIVKRIHDNAEKQITEEIRQKVEKVIFACDYFGRPTSSLSNKSEMMFAKFIEEHKTEIIECAGKYLAEKLAKTKAAREIIGGAKNE